MTHDEMIEVLQAHKDGRAIRARTRWEVHSEWTMCNDPAWDFTRFDFEVAPEPRRFWVNMYEGGTKYVHESKDAADAGSVPPRAECIEVVEVLKDDA